MYCPVCKYHRTTVRDSRPKKHFVWRRRKYLKCGLVFTTRESFLFSDMFLEITKVVEKIEAAMDLNRRRLRAIIKEIEK